MLSKRVKLKLQVEKFPSSSIAVSVITVSLLMELPIAGNCDTNGLGSQLSKAIAFVV